MHRIFSFFLAFTLSLIALQVTLQLPALTEDAGASEKMYLPPPLAARLSADGNELTNGVPLKAIVKDPNPAPVLRKIPAPVSLSSAPENATANFSITYIDAGDTDEWGEECYTFPEEAKAAFDAAANIWANTLTSGVPITINACWANMGAVTTLGYSGGGTLHGNFPSAIRLYTWYSASLANALSGSDLASSNADMHITYNSNFTWYYGTDGNTPAEEYDLMTVVLHEIAHGLNFSGSMSYSSGVGSYGYGTPYPNIYDVYMEDGSGVPLLDYPNSSMDLGSAMVSEDIWFNGSRAMAANGDQPVKIHAPDTWSSGSSYSHLDYNTFNGTDDQLMVYAISAGESIHDPGVITEGLLRDLGWPTIASSPLPTVTTQDVNGIRSTSATGNGNITDLGATYPTQHGVCWNTIGMPTTDDTHTMEGAVATTGAFTSLITGLRPNTTYYARAYATNTVGTSYGEEVSFTTEEDFTSAEDESSRLLLLYLPTIINGATNTSRDREQ